jgi:hypothetical protein
MEKLANLILKSPVNTVLAVIICSLIPGLFLVTLVILGLVTLRKGASASLPILVLISGLLSCVYYFVLGSLPIAVYIAIILILPIWILATVLRATVSLEETLLAAVGVVVAIAVMVLIIGGWNLQSFYELWVYQMGITSQEITPQTQGLLKLLSEVVALWPASMFMQYVFVILVARWWQARAFNPGGFQKEFHNLHFSKVVTTVAAIVIVVGFTLGSPIIRSLGLVAVALLSLHGLSMVHWYCTKRKIGWVLVPFYFVLLIVGWIVVPVLLVLSLVDSFYSLRTRSELN